MIEYYRHTQDGEFGRKTLMPVLTSVLDFFDQQYERDENGRLYMTPAQALETWFDCINPMPDVAGLHWVLKEALMLPESIAGRDQKDSWLHLNNDLPPIPIRDKVRYFSQAGKDGKAVFTDEVMPLKDNLPALAPAEYFAQKRNRENPELYAVFPYRLYAFNRPDIDLALRAFDNRLGRSNRGWGQDPIHAALLGLTEEAERMVYERTHNKHKESRFPVMWGPNADWIPDQDHGSVFMITLQSMLIQSDGDSIFLFPAWPVDWDVRFRLHAPGNTTVEGVLENGNLVEIKVNPEARKINLSSKFEVVK
jgi:hypothetical protein